MGSIVIIYFNIKDKILMALATGIISLIHVTMIEEGGNGSVLYPVNSHQKTSVPDKKVRDLDNNCAIWS